MKEYSVVIPAYNEADKISSTLTQVVSFMRTFTESFEIVVSDDGSTDATAEIASEFARNNPEVLILRNSHKGKSPTVWSGVMRADAKYIYLADADLSTPISELKRLSVWITDQGYDVVIGSREGEGARRINEPYYRHLVGRIFNLWVQMIALPGINDSQCGFKLFKGEVAKDVFSRLQIYGSTSQVISKPSFGAFDVEVLYLARKLNYKIKEVPVVWKFVKTSRFNPIQNSIKMAADVVKVRINDLKGIYKPSDGENLKG